jgi:hypothetical protein
MLQTEVKKRAEVNFISLQFSRYFSSSKTPAWKMVAAVGM